MISCSAVLLGFLSAATSSAAQSRSPSAVPSRIIAPVSDNITVRLPGNLHPLALPQFDTGAAPGSMNAGRLMLILRRSPQQDADLESFLRSVQDPASPRLHAYLTPEQFGLRFGPSDADLAAVQTWLRSRGFAVAGVNKGRTAIEFSGTMDQVQAAFHTAIHTFNIDGAQHFANTVDPQIPAALASVVAGVSSLNDFKPAPALVKGPAAQWDSAAGRFIPQLTGTVSGSKYLFVTPGDAATIYNSPNGMNAKFANGQTAYDGAGVIIGVVGTTGLSNAGTWYRTLFGLPNATNNSIVFDGDQGNIDLSADQTEAILDFAISGGLAPQAGIYYYAAGDTAFQSGLFLAIYRAIDDNKVDILSVSYGECEAALGAAGNLEVLNAWQQAAAQGIAVTVASGDSGSAGCDNPNLVTAATKGFGISGLASTPYNIAVGGTDFDVLANQFATYVNSTNSSNYTSALGYIPEEPWNDSTSVNGALASNKPLKDNNGNTNVWAGGGGPSTAGNNAAGYVKPAWQQGFTPSNNDSVRDIPDVSLLAGSGQYQALWAICIGNDCMDGANSSVHGVGGTSAAAPAFAGMLALVQQKIGARLGQAAWVLYKLAQTNPSAFHAVNTGNISVVCEAASPNCGSNSFLTGYNAGAGYNFATGLGSVDATALVNHWGDVTQSTTTTLALDKTGFVHGTPVGISVSVAPAGATGQVAIENDYTSQNLATSGTPTSFVQLSSGSGSETFSQLPGGTYHVWAHYAGDGSHAGSVSQPVQVTVTPEDTTIQFSAYTFDQNHNLVDLSGKAILFGSLVSLNARPIGVSQSGSGNSISNATGAVSFIDPSLNYGLSATPIDSSGLAELNTIQLPAGRHSISVDYYGDLSYNRSSAGPVTFTIAGIPTTISLSATVTSTIGSSITIDANLAANLTLNAVSPTGVVTFTNMTTGKVLGTGIQMGICTGATTLCIPYALDVMSTQLAGGANSIVAEYGGDTNYNDSGPSAAFTLTCNAGCYNASGYTLSLDFYQMSPSNGTIGAGGSLTTNVGVNPGGGFTGAVNLTCSVAGTNTTDQNIPTCSFKPPQVNITDPKAAVETVLTIATTAPKSNAVQANHARLVKPLNALALATLVFCMLPIRRFRRRFLLVLATLLFVGGFSSCGGGSNGGGGGGGGNTIPGTTPDTYTVSFRAVDAATGTVTAQDYFNIAVQ